MSRLVKWLQVIVLVALFGTGFHAPAAHAQESSRFFPETGQTVKGRFLEYWNTNGGLMQQGYPISGELNEKSATDGKTYTVQYFERAVFELHPENARPFDVLLSLLGAQRYNAKYPNGAPAQRANEEAGSVFFPETGKRVGGSFLVYFNQYGGVPQQGLPISDEFMERSDLDGKIRVVQYFERAVFEWNPDNKPPFNVLLAQLGTFAYKSFTQPVLLEPALPRPLDPSKGQCWPHVEGHYMLWSEGYIIENKGWTYKDFDIRVIDLTTNQPLIVADAPGNQMYPAMDGSLVAWQNKNASFVSGAPVDGIYAKDMATGKSYEIGLDGGEKGTWDDAAVAGRNVVASRTERDSSTHIDVKNVDTGAVTEIFKVPATTTVGVIEGLQASGRFVVWGVIGYSNDGKTNPEIPYVLYTYDLQTAKLSTLFQVGNGDNSSPWPLYSLDGNSLAIADRKGNITIKDLLAGTQLDIQVVDDVSALDLYGDRLLITTDDNATEILGLDLTKPEQGTARLLVTDPSVPITDWPRYGSTLAGDWLVWSDSNVPLATLEKKPLDLIPVNNPNNQSLPALPKPAKDRAQYIVSTYGPWIIYWDCPISSLSTGQAPCFLRGYDLNTQKDIPYMPGLSPEQAVEVVLAPGGLLVWRLVSPLDCGNCSAPGIYAVDLTNGKSYAVAATPASRDTVAAYGKNVVWIERYEDADLIVGKNVETGEVKTYRHIKTGTISLSHLQFSDVFLAWAEQDTHNLEGEKSSILVLNTDTGEMATVYAYNWNASAARSLLISLDISRIAVKYGSTFFVHNLRTGEKVFMGGQNAVVWMQLQGKIVVYATVPFEPRPNSAPLGTAIYALHIDEPEKVYTLIAYHPSGNENHAGSLSTPNLYYSDSNAQQPHLRALRLPYELLNR